MTRRRARRLPAALPLLHPVPLPKREAVEQFVRAYTDPPRVPFADLRNKIVVDWILLHAMYEVPCGARGLSGQCYCTTTCAPKADIRGMGGVVVTSWGRR